MKRSRTMADVERDIEAIDAKRARYEDIVRSYERMLRGLREEQDAMEEQARGARSIEVPVSAFETAAMRSISAWIERDVEDAYHEYRECVDSENCWYRGNLDRVDELCHLYTLRGSIYSLCDMCVRSAHCREKVLGLMHPIKDGEWNARQSQLVKVDPMDYESDLAAYLRCVAQTGDLDEAEELLPAKK